MGTAGNLFDLAQLAEASYAQFDKAAVDAALVAEKFSSTQVADLVARWSELDHRPDTASSFSATLFATRESAGEMVLAIRGTRGLMDLSTDLGDIVLDGLALYQIVDLYNYWQYLTAPEGSAYSVARIVPWDATKHTLSDVLTDAGVPTNRTVTIERGSSTVFFGGTDRALAVGAASGATKLTVTGHSLGGHLAAAFTRLFPQTSAQALTVNGAGFMALSPNVNTLFRLLNGAATFDPNCILNVYGDKGPEIVAQDWYLQQAGGHYPVFIEALFGNTLGHGSSQMTDSLAVHNLFVRLSAQLKTAASGVATAQLKPLFEAASAQAESSLERVVDGLVKFFGLDLASLSETNKIGDREALYQRIVPLRAAIDNLTANTPGMTVDVLAKIPAGDLTNLAQGSEALGYRYALKELNPFAILGDNNLYAPHNLNGELNLYDSANHTGTLTTQWITDRAEFLSRKNQYFTADGQIVLRRDGNENYVFENRTDSKTTDLTFTVVGNLAAIGNSDASTNPVKVLFGSDGTDNLTGGILADRLYGGGGTDWLEGRSGNDNLEGGKGLDVYNYNAFNGLFGHGNDGFDTILDIDGKGVLRYVFRDGASANPQSTVIAEATVRVSGIQWQSADGRFSYTRSQDDLIVTANTPASGSMTLKNFKDGDYGIHLWEARVDPQTAGNTILGDREPQDFDPAPGVQEQKDSLGNVIVTGTVQLNRDDVLYGDRPAAVANPTAPGEKIDAGGGNDIIFSDRPNGNADNGLGNADWIIGGAGRDQIEAGAGNDLIEAGADGAWTQTIAGQTIADLGGDIVDGGSGDDEIYAETKITLNAAIVQGNVNDPTSIKGDFLYGGAGDDWIIGGRGHDVLNGGAGKDLIVGGAGDDTIDGDIVESAAVLNWTAGRAVTNVNGFTDYVVTTTGLVDRPGEVFDVDAGEADVIYGGSGQDWIYARGGDDFIDAGIGNDVVIGGAGADILIGGEGNDVLIGDNGDFTSSNDGGDYLDGGAGDDTLVGGGSSDILIGGTGNDILRGGAGKDIYVFNKGDGVDTVVDVPADSGAADASVLVLGDGFSKGDIKFRTGSLLVDLGAVDPSDPDSTHDMIHFEGFDPFDPNSTEVLGEIRFADGTSMNYGDILAQGFDIDGTEGNDDEHDADHPMLVGTAVTDRIRGFGGNDVLLGAGGNDVLDGGAGNDQLQGGEGNDILLGGEGNDVLLGENGDDVLDGGTGADTMSGGAGNDTYIADFSDTIIDTEGGNAIQFSADVTLDSLRAQNLVINGDNYLLLYQDGAPQTIPGIPDGLKIKGDLDQLNFSFASAGGAVISQQQLLSTAFIQDRTVAGTNGDDLLTGYAGNDTLSGYSGNDTLTGGRGDDTLIGYDGSDTYVFNLGDGHDTIQENGQLAIGIPDTEGIDAIRFGAGITAGDVTLTRQADGNLVIAYGSGDRVTVNGQYTNIINSIERIEFDDGTVIDAASLAALPIAPISGTGGDDVLGGTTADDTLVGLAGNDTLDGGPAARFLGLPTGNDRLEGGAGADRYAMYLGMGQDTLVDASTTAEETSTLALDAGLTFDSLKATRDGNDLIVGLRGTQDSASIQGYYDAAAATQHWQIGFADGSTIPLDELINRVDPYADNVALQAREDYRQGVLANWSAQSVPLTLPTLAYVFSSWSQTTTTYYYDPAFPPLVEVLPQVDYSVVYGYGIRQGNAFSPISSLQSLITPVVVSQQGDAADVYPVGVPQTTAQSVRYGVWLGGSVGAVHGIGLTTVTVPASANFFNTTVSYDSTGWRSIGLTSNPGAGFANYFNVTQVNEQRIVEEITAGDSNNNIYAGIGANHVALVDAGAGDDYVSADSNDFVYGNDGDDTVSGGHLVYGGDGDDMIIGGHLVYGGDGYDTIYNAEIAIGGAGNDFVQDARRTVVLPEDTGHDTMYNPSGPGEDALAEWYYNSIGMPGWREMLRDPQTEEPRSIEEVIALGLLPPLPPITANDWNALTPLYASGWIEKDALDFGSGVSADDLTFSWGQTTLTPQYGGEQPYVTLDVGITPDNVVSVVIPHSDDLLGAGIEEFRFADGTVMSISEIIALAPPAPSFDPQLEPRFELGWAYLEFDADQIRTLNKLQFGQSISPGDISATRADNDLLLSHANGDQIRLVGWYADPANMPVLAISFDDGTMWSADYLTAEGITLHGTTGDDTIYGTSGPDIIDGGTGIDYIFGDAGNDTFIFGRGYGQDVFEEYDETLGNIDTVRFAADVAHGDVTVSGENGDLILSINDTDDQVVLQYWFWDDESKIEQVAFADGTVWDITALESMVPMADATEDADLIFGTSGDDLIDGLGGEDQIIGGGGNDILSGGEDNDYLIGDRGDDILLGGAGADELEDWSGSNYLNAGSGDDSIIVNGGASFVIGGSGADWIENFSEAIVIAFNAGDGQDTIYAASSLTLSLGGGIHAADLSLRREGMDLVLEIGATDSIRLTRQWEADPEAWPQITLQLIDAAVSTYDLNEIINKYNDLQSSDPTLISWQIGDALASAPLNSSTDFALGGELAYHYASTGSNDELAPEIIRGIVSDPAFSVDPQPFEAAAPALTGTAGDDVLTGNDGPDTLIGGAGNDTLDGGAGDDIYVFDPGSGVDLIQDSAGMDTVAFGSGITPEMLTLGLGSLLIRVGDGGDAIHLEGFDPANVYGSPVIESFTFSGNAVLTYDDLLSRGFDLAGTDGNDAITGTNVADRINGLGGNDTLAGGAGDDTYVYQAGDGLDTIADEAGNDTTAFGTGLTRDNVVARMSGDNTTARVRVLDAYGNEQADQGLDIELGSGGNSPIEWFTFATDAPATLDDLLIRQEVHTGTLRNDVIRAGRNDDAIYADRDNDVVYAGAGNDVIFGDRGRDILYGEAGNDVLVGGRGKDQLYGGYGDDVLEGGRGTDILDGGADFNTYVFERNFGDDRIVSSGGSGALRFGAGIAARDLSFKRRNNDLVVKVNGDGRIRIEGWFDAKAAHPVARAEFADGTILNADEFVAKGYDYEPERDEDDDDDDEDGSHYGNGDSEARPHGAPNNEDHGDVRTAKTPSGHGKSSDLSDSAWFERVVEKWDAHYARSAQPNAESGDARSGTSHSEQSGNRWQHMHERLAAHLADGQDDSDSGGADLASLKPDSAHGPSFTQFGSVGYGGVGVEDRGAADLRPVAGLREGLARIA